MQWPRSGAMVVLAMFAITCAPSSPVVIADVTYQLDHAEPDGCITVDFAPDVPLGKLVTGSVPLSGRGAAGLVKVAAMPEDDWDGQVEVTAQLRVPKCSGPSVAIASDRVVPRGTAVHVALRLLGGAGGGAGGGGGGAAGGGSAGGGAAGGSAAGGGSAGGGSAGGGSAGGGSAGGGSAGGGSAGGGSAGGGSAGGGSAGGGSAGGAGGGSAGGGSAGGGAAGGGVSCDGGFHSVSVANANGVKFEGVGYGNPSAVWLAGADNNPQLRFRTDAGFVNRTGPPCGGKIAAAWARPNGQLYIAGDAFGVKSVVPGAADCLSIANSSVGANGLAGVELLAGALRLAVVGRGPPPGGGGGSHGLVHLLEMASGSVVSTQITLDVNSVATELYDVAAPPGLPGFFAVGSQGNQEAIIQEQALGGWTKATGFNSRGGRLQALAFVSASEGYAAGNSTLYRWDGVNWNAQGGSLPFDVFGLVALGPNHIIAVGRGEGIAQWNGGWSIIRNPQGGPFAPDLNRIAGPNACDLTATGTNSTYSTRP